MLIARYIFRQTASALIMILITLTLIVWLTSLLRDIKLLTSQGHTFILFMKITALMHPQAARYRGADRVPHRQPAHAEPPRRR